MDRFSELRVRYRSLPSLLRTATLALVILGIVVAAAPLIPGMTFNLDGEELTWREMWETRVALALLVLGPLMTSVGLGVLFGRRWARPVLLLMPMIQILPLYLVHWVFDAPSPIRSVSVTTY